ncbi:hypothetical protein LI291_10820 [Intestinibacillus massiliensis]|nr:hypothetical protein [Intestinibacillus massiliensis]
MRYALLDKERTIVNIIECEPDFAPEIDAHYLGDSPLGIGDQYPAEDLTPPVVPTTEARLTALEAALLEVMSHV